MSNHAYRYREQKSRRADAKVQAARMLAQHNPTVARRMAAETALAMHPKRQAEGRAFWQEVLAVLMEE